MTDNRRSSEAARGRILTAAEQCFAHQGFDVASLRTITDAAGVNLAAVNYHFGSKELLFEEVFQRRIRPINEQRNARLDAAERTASGGVVALEEVVGSFVRPVFDPIGQSEEGLCFPRILAQAYHSPRPCMIELIARESGLTIKHFLRVLRRSLPQMPPDELLWRLMIMNGAMLFIAVHYSEWENLTHGVCRTGTTDSVVDRIVQFCTRGFSAGEYRNPG